MTVHESIMSDFKDIMETVANVSKVSYGPHVPLDQEEDWAAVYIIPGADTFTTYQAGKGVSSYDNSFLIRCLVNEDCEDDDLKWCETRDTIIQAVLQDSELWSTVVDRDVVSVVYDDMNSYPQMTMEILFEFKLREVCT